MSDRKIRYVIDEGTPFSVHGEGLTVQAHTRKSDIAVTVEIEGVTRKLLLQFRAAIDQELDRREAEWKSQREQLLRKLGNGKVAEQPVDQPAEVVAPEVAA
jgi:hypothetical protein